jgi:phenylalanyl-tRNA synthetase alpha subunit
LKPIVKEFEEDKAVKEEISNLSAQGITKKDLYVMSHDESRAKKVAEEANAKQMSSKEDSLGSKVVNILREKDEELRHRFKELGFSQEEANQLEEKLADGKILLIIGDHKDPRGA